MNGVPPAGDFGQMPGEIQPAAHRLVKTRRLREGGDDGSGEAIVKEGTVDAGEAVSRRLGLDQLAERERIHGGDARQP